MLLIQSAKDKSLSDEEILDLPDEEMIVDTVLVAGHLSVSEFMGELEKDFPEHVATIESDRALIRQGWVNNRSFEIEYVSEKHEDALPVTYWRKV